MLLAQALFGRPDILVLDEPTNHLDIQAIQWLEGFLLNFENTAVVVSHDRYFLNKVCTHIADIDFGRIQLYAGNYDFWYESSQLAQRLAAETNRKKEEKVKDLQEFIARFSANASKSRQATSRKKLLEKITLDDIRPSNRKYPFVNFVIEREIGNELLRVEGLTKSISGEKVLDRVSFTLNRDDKVAFVGTNELATTTLFQILMGETEADSGSFKWGVTTSRAYFAKDASRDFTDRDLNLIEWLRQYSPNDQTETFLRGFLGRMLFSGEEVLKSCTVISGGERVRCMLARMMLTGANVLVMDEPTNHLDLESISALNDGMIRYKGSMLFRSHDHQFVQTIANRIMELTPDGLVDKQMTYDEYLVRHHAASGSATAISG